MTAGQFAESIEVGTHGPGGQRIGQDGHQLGRILQAGCHVDIGGKQRKRRRVDPGPGQGDAGAVFHDQDDGIGIGQVYVRKEVEDDGAGSLHGIAFGVEHQLRLSFSVSHGEIQDTQRVRDTDMGCHVFDVRTDHLALVTHPVHIVAGVGTIDKITFAVGIGLDTDPYGVTVVPAVENGDIAVVIERDPISCSLVFVFNGDNVFDETGGVCVQELGHIHLDYLVGQATGIRDIIDSLLRREFDDGLVDQGENHEVRIGSIDTGEDGGSVFSLRGTPAGLVPGFAAVETVPPDSVFDLELGDGSRSADALTIAVGHPGRRTVRAHLDRPVISTVLFVELDADNGDNAVGAAVDDQRRAAGERDAVAFLRAGTPVGDTDDMVVFLQRGNQAGKVVYAFVELVCPIFQFGHPLFEQGDPLFNGVIAAAQEKQSGKQKDKCQDSIFHNRSSALIGQNGYDDILH